MEYLPAQRSRPLFPKRGYPNLGRSLLHGIGRVGGVEQSVRIEEESLIGAHALPRGLAGLLRQCLLCRRFFSNDRKRASTRRSSASGSLTCGRPAWKQRCFLPPPSCVPTERLLHSL